MYPIPGPWETTSWWHPARWFGYKYWRQEHWWFETDPVFYRPQQRQEQELKEAQLLLEQEFG